jgi:hypothetical protein
MWPHPVTVCAPSFPAIHAAHCNNKHIIPPDTKKILNFFIYKKLQKKATHHERQVYGICILKLHTIQRKMLKTI